MSEETSYNCDVCGQKFATADGLGQHKRDDHKQ